MSITTAPSAALERFEAACDDLQAALDDLARALAPVSRLADEMDAIQGLTQAVSVSSIATVLPFPTNQTTKRT